MNHHMHLKFLQRVRRDARPTVAPGTALPPRELFAQLPAVLALYDAFTRADEARAKHEAEALRLSRAATAETTDYPARVRDAIRAGKDATKETNNSQRLSIEAAAHEDLAKQARTEVQAIGNQLGEAIAEHADEVYPAIEAQLDAAAGDIRDAVASLRTAWSSWAAAWKLRSALGWLKINGGQLSGYRASVALDADMRAALDSMLSKLDDLPTLRAEEAHVTAWRTEQDQRDETNRRRAEASAANVHRARAEMASRAASRL